MAGSIFTRKIERLGTWSKKKKEKIDGKIIGDDETIPISSQRLATGEARDAQRFEKNVGLRMKKRREERRVAYYTEKYANWIP